jgi:hypothetical protein
MGLLVGSENKLSPNHLWLAKEKMFFVIYSSSIHPLSSIHYHPSLMGVLMATCSLWPQMAHSTPAPNSRPKRTTTTQRVVVGGVMVAEKKGARKARAKGGDDV